MKLENAQKKLKKIHELNERRITRIGNRFQKREDQFLKKQEYARKLYEREKRKKNPSLPTVFTAINNLYSDLRDIQYELYQNVITANQTLADLQVESLIVDFRYGKLKSLKLEKKVPEMRKDVSSLATQLRRHKKGLNWVEKFQTHRPKTGKDDLEEMKGSI